MIAPGVSIHYWRKCRWLIRFGIACHFILATNGHSNVSFASTLRNKRPIAQNDEKLIMLDNVVESVVTHRICDDALIGIKRTLALGDDK